MPPNHIDLDQIILTIRRCALDPALWSSVLNGVLYLAIAPEQLCALIDRSKTDQEGQAGATAYLAPTTVRMLQAWLERTGGIESGLALFRQVRGLLRWASRLRPAAMATVFKRLARWIGCRRINGSNSPVHLTRGRRDPRSPGA